MKRSLLQVEQSRSCPSNNQDSIHSFKKQRTSASCHRRRRVSFAATPVFVEQPHDDASVTDDEDVDTSDHHAENDTTTIKTSIFSFPTRQAQEGCPSIFSNNVLTLEEIQRLWYNEDDLRRSKQRTRSLVLQQQQQRKHPQPHKEDTEEESLYGLQKYSWERSRHKKSALWYVLAAHSEYPHHPSFIKAVSERCTGWAKQVARIEAMDLVQDLYGRNDENHNKNRRTKEASSSSTTTNLDVKVVGLPRSSSSSSSPTIEESSSSSVASLVSEEEEEQDAAAAVGGVAEQPPVSTIDVPMIVDDDDDDVC